MGNDDAVVQAARVSYGRGTKSTREDAALISYLMRHSHTSPFEMCEIKIHAKMPIFVARQWIRHRTASVNEYSARYSVLDREFYLPSAEHLAVQSRDNRQGRGEELSSVQAEQVIQLLREDATRAYDHYLEMLNEQPDGSPRSSETAGLARELARINLSLNFYTQWYWKIDLHNLLHFLKLRTDPHAQYEIRVYAEKLFDIVKLWVPATAEAFEEHVLHGVALSRTALRAVRRMLAGEQVCSAETSGLSRENGPNYRYYCFQNEPSAPDATD